MQVPITLGRLTADNPSWRKLPIGFLRTGDPRLDENPSKTASDGYRPSCRSVWRTLDRAESRRAHKFY